MRKSFFVVWLFFAQLVVSNATAEELNIDVMSFNIRDGTAEDARNHWEARKILLFDVIRDSDPDIIGLQEAFRFQIDEIRSSVPGYKEIGEGKEGGEEGELSAILYRIGRFYVERSGTFWLSDTPEIPSKHWGNATVRTCTWVRLVDTKSKNAFYVFNTHLDHKSLPSRVRSVRLISDRIIHREFQDSFVLMGDFNAGEDSPSIRYLKGENVGKVITPLLMDDWLVLLRPAIRYLNRLVRKEITSLPVVDTFRVLHARQQKVGTNHGFKGRVDGIKVDYIFVPPGTQTLSADILRTERNGRYPSDHFPVTARIKFKFNPN